MGRDSAEQAMPRALPSFTLSPSCLSLFFFPFAFSPSSLQTSAGPFPSPHCARATCPGELQTQIWETSSAGISPNAITVGHFRPLCHFGSELDMSQDVFLFECGCLRMLRSGKIQRDQSRCQKLGKAGSWASRVSPCSLLLVKLRAEAPRVTDVLKILSDAQDPG